MRGPNPRSVGLLVALILVGLLVALKPCHEVAAGVAAAGPNKLTQQPQLLHCPDSQQQIAAFALNRQQMNDAIAFCDLPPGDIRTVQAGGAYCGNHDAERKDYPVDPGLANALLESGILAGKTVVNLGAGFGAWNEYISGELSVKIGQPLGSHAAAAQECNPSLIARRRRDGTCICRRRTGSTGLSEGWCDQDAVVFVVPIAPLSPKAIALRPALVGCFDGQSDVESKTAGRCKYVDLTRSTKCLVPVVDWVVCLEVLEHVPAEKEDAVLQALTGHATEGLVLSWGAEGQSGFNHVNGRNRIYVITKLRGLGFVYKDALSTRLRAVASYWWFRDTFMVFVRAPVSPPKTLVALNNPYCPHCSELVIQAVSFATTQAPTTTSTLTLRPCPKTAGRLGNQMFQWASSAGIALKNQMRLCEGKLQNILRTSFVGPPYFSGESQLPCPPSTQINRDPGYGIYAPFEPTDHAQLAPGFYRTFKYFNEHAPEIRKALQFSKSIKDQVNAYMSNKKRPIVGIHVRRGDFGGSGANIPSDAFYKTVMDHFTTKLGPAVSFLIASNGADWCAHQPVFQGNNIHVIIEKHSPIVDMAILTDCDHVAISTGTFGWWAGWLGPSSRDGEVVYCGDAQKMSSPINKGKLIKADYYPPEWLPLECAIH